ncbi:MAG: TonB-dependent receptor [Pseudomonadota bacterium]
MLFIVASAASALLTQGANDSIVVTAERREQSVSETPASLAVIDRQSLTTINADHIAEALARAPGVNLHRGSGAEHLTAIRSPVLTGGAGAGSFLFLENGVPLRSPGFANVNGLLAAHHEIADQIEIVRGPSGAFYGANAIHGVVNVLTPSPTSADAFAAEIFGDTEDRYKWKGALSGSRGDHAGYLGVSAVSESGYREDAGLDQQKLTARHRIESGGVSADTILSFTNTEQETAGFIFGRDALFDRVRRRENEFPFAYRDAKSARLQSTLTFPAGEKGEFRVTPFGRWNDMTFPQHFLPGAALEENGHWSVGAQSAYYHEAGAIDWAVGVDLEYTEGRLREFQSNPTVFSFVQGLHYDYRIAAKYVSGFTQARIELSQSTEFTVAGRLDATFYDYDNRAEDGVFGRFLRPADRTDDFVTASPKVTLRQEVSPTTFLTVSYARGARPPQTTDLYRLQINQTGDRARPELIDAFEVSLRSAPREDIQFALAAYWMKKRNFFFRDADGFNVANGKTRHIGFEADVNIALTNRLSLLSAVSYGAHTYRFSRITGSETESIALGNDVDTAPRVIANTRLAWRPFDRLSLEAEWRSIGQYFTDAANANSYEGYDLLNLRANASLTERLDAFLILRNATDELYAERADFAFGNERFFPGETRTLGFGLRFRQ